jgi:hypothetical protein
MQEKIELNRVRTFSEIIEDTILFFKQTWKPLLKAYFSICGFFLAASLIVGIFNVASTLQNTARGESIFTFTYFMTILFGLMDSLLVTLTLLCFISLYKEKGNEPPTVQEVWSYVKFFFFRIAGSYLALGALIFAGFVCCFIPGIYFIVVFSLTFPIMVMENTTLGYAFNRSFQIIKKNWWFTFGVLIVISIVLVAVIFAAAIPVTLIAYGAMLFTKAGVFDVYSYGIVVFTHLVQFFYLVPLIGITLTYFSLTEMKDDGTLLQRIMMIGKSSTDAHEAPTEEY